MRTMNRNIKLILEYDGTNYHGWQSQAGTGKPTIQDTLELALQTLTKTTCKVWSSGRTDAGVHAIGHVANFKTRSSIPSAAWAPALNQLLPDDIRVLASEEMPPDFHARFSALRKIYQYRILNRSAPSALYRHYAWHINLPLNLGKMRTASSHLVGRHDFSAFRGAGCGAKTAVRTLSRAEIRRRGDFVEIWLEADAFLQYMARNITGTLVDVGLGRCSPDMVGEVLKSKNRTLAGRTAPSRGLYLMEVVYS